MMSFHCGICKFLWIPQWNDIITRSSWCTASGQAASHRQETTSKILGGNTTFSFPGAFLIAFLWFFFYKRVLFSLRNTRTKFCAAALSRCGAMLKMGGNTTISIPGAFLTGFLWFFFINVFYLAYEIRVRSFVRLRWVVVELCWKWVETLPYHFQVRFLLDFFDFF